MITTNGTDNEKIKPESLIDYIVPPPVQVAISNEVLQQEIPNPAETDADAQTKSDIENETEEDDELITDFDEEMPIEKI